MFLPVPRRGVLEDEPRGEQLRSLGDGGLARKEVAGASASADRRQRSGRGSNHLLYLTLPPPKLALVVAELKRPLLIRRFFFFAEDEHFDDGIDWAAGEQKLNPTERVAAMVLLGHMSRGHATVADRLAAAGESEDGIIVVWPAVEAEAAVEDQEGAKHGGGMVEVVRGC